MTRRNSPPVIGKNPSWNLPTIARAVFLAVFLASPLAVHAQLYWDTNGDTDGAGNPADGTWSTSDANWSTSADGDVTTAVYTAGSDVVFSAGTDAATADVTVSGSHTVNSFLFEEGDVTFTGGNFDHAGGPVNITVASGANASFDTRTNFNGTFDVQGTGTLYGREFDGGSPSTKTGSGTATFDELNASLTVEEGLINVTGGKLKNTTIEGGTLRITGAAFDGTGRNLTVDSGGFFEMAPGVVDTVNALNGAGSISGDANSILTVQSGTFSGIATDDLSLTKTNAGTFTLSGAADYTGDTVVNGGTFSLASSGSMTFYIGTTGINNQIDNNSILDLDGTFVFDLSGADSVGFWQIVDNSGTVSYDQTTFNVAGFDESAPGIWTMGDYTFTESSGQLTAIPEPTTVMMVLGGLGVLLGLQRGRRRRRG